MSGARQLQKVEPGQVSFAAASPRHGAGVAPGPDSVNLSVKSFPSSRAWAPCAHTRERQRVSLQSDFITLSEIIIIPLEVSGQSTSSVYDLSVVKFFSSENQ